MSDGKSNRGFASMVTKDPDRQKKIASLGGKRAHQLGTAHEFTPDEAKEAGRKGGQRSSKLRSDQYFHQIDQPKREKRPESPVAETVDLNNVVELDPYFDEVREGR